MDGQRKSGGGGGFDWFGESPQPGLPRFSRRPARPVPVSSWDTAFRHLFKILPLPLGKSSGGKSTRKTRLGRYSESVVTCRKTPAVPRRAKVAQSRADLRPPIKPPPLRPPRSSRRVGPSQLEASPGLEEDRNYCESCVDPETDRACPAR